jgi:hypothetical protein
LWEVSSSPKNRIVQAARQSAPRKKRRSSSRRSAAQFEHYEITVGRWEHYYGFRTGDQKFDPKPYSHTETVTWYGDVLRPEGIQFPKAEVTLSAHDELMSERATRRSIIGTINAHDDVLYAYVFVPAEHMGQLVALAASGRLKMISLVGEPLKWRKASIRSISLNTENEDTRE